MTLSQVFGARRTRARIRAISEHEPCPSRERAAARALEELRRLAADRALAEAAEEFGTLTPEEERGTRAHLFAFIADLDENMARLAYGDR